MVRTCVVTGASTGIGLALARQLAVRGNLVILVCRDLHRGNEALKWVRAAAPQGRAELLVADLRVQREVRRVAAELSGGWSSVNVLVNNAAIGYMPNRTLTADGDEVTFAVNCIAPFLLTSLLGDALSRGAPSRVVNVVENVRDTVQPILDDLDMRDGYSGTLARRRSQAALLLLSQEFARRFASRNITVNCIDPGHTRTELFAAWPLSLKLIDLPTRLTSQSPHQAARAIAQLAEGPEHMRVTGMCFSRYGRTPLSNGVLNQALARALWNKLAGLCSA